MLKEFLYAKIHRATVTEANLDYIGSITIDKALTINGHGHTLDGNKLSSTRIFHVSTNSKVVFQNIIFTGATNYAVYFINSNGNSFEFINCTFKDNTFSATNANAYGGAVYCSNTVSNSK